MALSLKNIPLRSVAKALLSRAQRRHVLRWIRSFEEDYYAKNRLPWIPFDAIDHLRGLPLSSYDVFEYGSGGSTLFWTDHCRSCVSVEHNRQWEQNLLSRIRKGASVDYRVVTPERGTIGQGQASNPRHYSSDDAAYRGCNFRRYASVVDEFPDAAFGIVLVDGRARPSCILHSYRKVKAGGLLLVDNSDREYYLTESASLLEGFVRRDFFGLTPGLTYWSRTSAFAAKG
jgi:hypothetical protein